MKGSHTSTLLITLLLLAISVVEGRTWRRPSIVNSPSRSVFFRGGSDATTNIALDVDVGFTVPTTIKSSIVPPRGGSTATIPSTSTSSAHPPLISSSITRSISTTTLPSTSMTRTLPSTLVISSSLEDESVNATISSNSTAIAPISTKELRAHKKIAKKLKNRNHTNLRRKIMHASFGFFFAALNHFIPKAKFVPGMTILTSATLLMELLRYRRGFSWMNDILHFVLGSSLRKHEMDGKFTGSFYYFLGVTVTAALYPTSCATLGICQLAVADPTASYFGRATRHIYWSRIENGLGGIGRNKGILGFLGGALACVPMNYELLSRAQFSAPRPQLLMASVLLGLAGAFADLAVPTPTLTLPKKVLGVRVPPFHVDDNLVVPVFSGYACTQVFRYLNFPSELQLAKFLVW